MAFRTIVINSRCKLEYSLNYLICRRDTINTKVLLDEIKIIIINSTQVTLTSNLIAECIDKKIKIIFTDDRHNPVGEMVGYYNNYYSYRKIKEQMSFSEVYKNRLWQLIIIEKIQNQAKNLFYKNKIESYDMLLRYAMNVDNGDISNREGHSAKIYFNSLFGNEFNRNLDVFINRALNYGYSIVLSSINREIKSLGYLTELGVHHIGESNPFNLSCDFIEPLRPLIDSLVIKEIVNEADYKEKYINLLSMKVKYNGKEIILDNAIHLYVEDLLNYLKTGNEERIRFITYEL